MESTIGCFIEFDPRPMRDRVSREAIATGNNTLRWSYADYVLLLKELGGAAFYVMRSFWLFGDRICVRVYTERGDRVDVFCDEIREGES